MSEPSWELLGGGGVAGPAGIVYMGAWAAGTAYQPGQVVRYNGVDYLAVNASTGQTPPAATLAAVAYGTSLPVSPFDGQEAVLVDSITNPSYQWRFRFNAGSTSPYKWEFIGGSPMWRNGAGSFTLTANAWTTAPTTEDLIVPRSGDYSGEMSGRIGVAVVNQQCYAGIANASVGSTPVGPQGAQVVGNYGSIEAFPILLGLAAGNTLRMSFFAPVASCTADYRVMKLTPVRVA